MSRILRRWLTNENQSPRSGWSIFTLEIPTGYRIDERFLKDLVGFGIVRNLRDAENYPNRLNFLFEFVCRLEFALVSLVDRIVFF